jgi:2',3'-cyclic-nucleotide 2'-phosphodiesterase (5'-nucleotidase family)
VARSLPRGLVDVIAAGHTHGGLAHQVDGIAIIQPFSRGQALQSRRRRLRSEDQERRAGPALRTAQVCAQQDPVTGNCAPATDRRCRRVRRKAVTPDPAIVQAMAPALERVHELQATTLGVSLDAPIRRVGDLGSPLGNLFAEALRDAVPGADVAVINNAARGLGRISPMARSPLDGSTTCSRSTIASCGSP